MVNFSSDELRSNEQTNINNDLDEDEKGMDIPITNAFYETELFWLGFRDHIGDYILYISLVALIAIVNRVQTIPQKSIEKVKLINIVEIYSDKFIEKIEKLDLNKLSNCILDMKFTSHNEVSLPHLVQAPIQAALISYKQFYDMIRNTIFTLKLFF